jgi:uncharacterized protein YqhQ
VNGGTEGAQPVRAGGQALADGVLMRTERAWAIARIDGTIETGELPGNRFSAVPVLRVLAGLGSALKLGIMKGMLRKGAGGDARVRGSRRANRKFLFALLGAEAVVAGLGLWLGRLDVPQWGTALLTLLPWVAVLGVMRLATAPSLWRFHGAEHKAVAAHERSIDLDDTDAVLACPRVHNRCGTNLVFLLAVLSLAMVAVPTAIQLPLFLVALGVTVELVSLAARWPRFLASRALLSGGRMLQRVVTTAEPTPAEQAVACRALSAALATHARLEAAEVAVDERVRVAA